jgi:hypothetical protein
VTWLKSRQDLWLKPTTLKKENVGSEQDARTEGDEDYVTAKICAFQKLVMEELELDVRQSSRRQRTGSYDLRARRRRGIPVIFLRKLDTAKSIVTLTRVADALATISCFILSMLEPSSDTLSRRTRSEFKCTPFSGTKAALSMRAGK